MGLYLGGVINDITVSCQGPPLHPELQILHDATRAGVSHESSPTCLILCFKLEYSLH